jgi:hypothetical protein
MRYKKLALVVNAVGAPAAQAAGAPVAPAASCDVQIGLTYRSGNTIVGHGSLSNCPPNSTANIHIERSVWYGWQNTTGDITVRGPGYDQYVYYNCSGTGTHQFQTVIDAYTVGGSYLRKTSNTITATC